MVMMPSRYTLHRSFLALPFSWRYFVSLATPVLAETMATRITARMVPAGSYTSA